MIIIIVGHDYTKQDKIGQIMNLSVKRVAKMLNVSEKTIYRMIRNETIPCFRVGGQWRFDRREISSWIEDTRAFSHQTDAKGSLKEDEELISISEFLQRGGIYYDISGSTKETAVISCLESIKKGVPIIDTKKLFENIMDREALCSTAVGHSIALPHPRSFKKLTSYSYIALCYLENPVPFHALDNEDVDTLFFVFPKSEKRFLRIQSKLFRLLRDEEVLEVIRKVSSLDNICEVFARKEAEIFKDALS